MARTLPQGQVTGPSRLRMVGSEPNGEGTGRHQHSLRTSAHRHDRATCGMSGRCWPWSKRGNDGQRSVARGCLRYQGAAHLQEATGVPVLIAHVVTKRRHNRADSHVDIRARIEDGLTGYPE